MQTQRDTHTRRHTHVDTHTPAGHVWYLRLPACPTRRWWSPTALLLWSCRGLLAHFCSTNQLLASSYCSVATSWRPTRTSGADRTTQAPLQEKQTDAHIHARTHTSVPVWDPMTNCSQTAGGECSRGLQLPLLAGCRLASESQLATRRRLKNYRAG